jgi:hypothetical protein
MVDGKAPPEETGSINRIQNLNDQHGNNSIASDAKDGLVTGGVDVSREFGKLVITEGKGQYINSNFWATLTNEVLFIIGLDRDIIDILIAGGCQRSV